jgi:hypothetical protein
LELPKIKLEVVEKRQDASSVGVSFSSHLDTFADCCSRYFLNQIKDCAEESIGLNKNAQCSHPGYNGR